MPKNIFIDVSREVEQSEVFKHMLEDVERFIPDDYEETVYILQKPMLVSKEKEYYAFGVTLIVQGSKIFFIDCNPDGSYDEEFKYYCEDFIDDINALITAQYSQYFNILKRKREWESYFVKIDNGGIDEYTFFNLNNIDSRKIKFLSQLIMGSIQEFKDFDLNILKEEELPALDAVKNKIVLFDLNQTKFVYKEDETKKTLTLQGLAGSGKTELLLHKIRKIFVEETDARIGVTCFNKVLAESLSTRIIDFFNTMKVSEQITYRRLFVAHSWGSEGFPNSGLYSRICQEYGIEFQRFSYDRKNSEVWQDAINHLNTLEKITPIFDYLFIDESQDFDKEFIELCEIVTEKRVYVAGDILQNIFSDESMLSYETTDYVLNKVYRTDPRTLLFSHVLGFGLLERPVVRWLEDKDWKMAGYHLENIKDNQFLISRKRVNRFEGSLDLKKVKAVEIIKTVDFEENQEAVLSVIDSIINNNPSVKATDIAIIYTYYSQKNTRAKARRLGGKIMKRYLWEYVLVPEEKRIHDENEITITNINNVKGLEFPFVIVIDNQGLNKINSQNTDIEIRKRNALYMALTRSFLTSYLIISPDTYKEENFTENLIKASKEIEFEAKIIVEKPSERDRIDKGLLYGLNSKEVITQEDLILKCIKDLNIPDDKKYDVLDIVLKNNAIKRGTMDQEAIKRIVVLALELIESWNI
ncbi:AAA family ATPase [Streptococcus sp. 10F2]